MFANSSPCISCLQSYRPRMVIYLLNAIARCQKDNSGTWFPSQFYFRWNSKILSQKHLFISRLTAVSNLFHFFQFYGWGFSATLYISFLHHEFLLLFFLKVILLFLLLNKQTKTTTHDVILKNWVKFRVAFNVTKNWSNCVGTSPFLVPKPQTFLVTYVTAQQFSVPSVQPTADAFTEVPIDTCQPHLTDTDSIHTDTSSWIYLSKIADHFMTLALYKI